MAFVDRGVNRSSWFILGLLLVLVLVLAALAVGEPTNPELRSWIATHGVPRCVDAPLPGWGCIVY